MIASGRQFPQAIRAYQGAKAKETGKNRRPINATTSPNAVFNIP